MFVSTASAEEAWDEYVIKLRGEKREALEEEYMDEMDSTVTAQLHDWETDEVEPMRTEFIERYIERHASDDDVD